MNFVNGRCVPWNETALVVVIAWNRTGRKPLFKPMVTQFTDSHMVKNKSKNKKTLFKFGTVKNNKPQLLFPTSVSHRPSHGYIPGAMYSNTEDLRSSWAHQQRLDGDTASCHYDKARCRQWRQKLSNRRLINFIEKVNRSSMNKIKEVFYMLLFLMKTSCHGSICALLALCNGNSR